MNRPYGQTIPRNHFPAFRSLTMMTVAKIELIEGLGVDGDPIRPVTYYVEPETGTVLARVDAFPSAGPAPTEEHGR